MYIYSAYKLKRLYECMEKRYHMQFDEQGVATIPNRTNCCDRGTVTIRTINWCKRPTTQDLSK